MFIMLSRSLLRVVRPSLVHRQALFTPFSRVSIPATFIFVIS